MFIVRSFRSVPCPSGDDPSIHLVNSAMQLGICETVATY
nr:MAG TPA: hypothetical protein [Caudoviricetes sp.]